MITMWKKKIKKKEPVHKEETKEPRYKVFVFCGGKCGSSTLVQTFTNIGMNSIHVHGEEHYKKKQQRIGSLAGVPLFSLIDRSRQVEPIIVIDSYRTPVERKISSFFQHLKVDKPIPELVDMFNAQFNQLENYHSINEVFDHYNIKRFSSFDFTKRFVAKREQNMVFVKVHFDDISRWGAILSKALGRPIALVADNLSSNKQYHATYTLFKQENRLPPEFLSSIEHDPEFTIYNTPQERTAYLEKWGRPN